MVIQIGRITNKRKVEERGSREDPGEEVAP